MMHPWFRHWQSYDVFSSAERRLIRDVEAAGEPSAQPESEPADTPETSEKPDEVKDPVVEAEERKEEMKPSVLKTERSLPALANREDLKKLDIDLDAYTDLVKKGRFGDSGAMHLAHSMCKKAEVAGLLLPPPESFRNRYSKEIKQMYWEVSVTGYDGKPEWVPLEADTLQKEFAKAQLAKMAEEEVKKVKESSMAEKVQESSPEGPRPDSVLIPYSEGKIIISVSRGQAEENLALQNMPGTLGANRRGVEPTIMLENRRKGLNPYYHDVRRRSTEEQWAVHREAETAERAIANMGLTLEQTDYGTRISLTEPLPHGQYILVNGYKLTGSEIFAKRLQGDIDSFIAGNASPQQVPEKEPVGFASVNQYTEQMGRFRDADKRMIAIKKALNDMLKNEDDDQKNQATVLLLDFNKMIQEVRTLWERANSSKDVRDNAVFNRMIAQQNRVLDRADTEAATFEQSLKPYLDRRATDKRQESSPAADVVAAAPAAPTSAPSVAPAAPEKTPSTAEPVAQATPDSKPAEPAPSAPAPQPQQAAPTPETTQEPAETKPDVLADVQNLDAASKAAVRELADATEFSIASPKLQKREYVLSTPVVEGPGAFRKVDLFAFMKRTGDIGSSLCIGVENNKITKADLLNLDAPGGPAALNLKAPEFSKLREVLDDYKSNPRDLNADSLNNLADDVANALLDALKKEPEPVPSDTAEKPNKSAHVSEEQQEKMREYYRLNTLLHNSQRLLQFINDYTEGDLKAVVDELYKLSAEDPHLPQLPIQKEKAVEILLSENTEQRKELMQKWEQWREELRGHAEGEDFSTIVAHLFGIEPNIDGVEQELKSVKNLDGPRVSIIVGLLLRIALDNKLGKLGPEKDAINKRILTAAQTVEQQMNEERILFAGPNEREQTASILSLVYSRIGEKPTERWDLLPVKHYPTNDAEQRQVGEALRNLSHKDFIEFYMSLKPVVLKSPSGNLKIDEMVSEHNSNLAALQDPLKKLLVATDPAEVKRLAQEASDIAGNAASMSMAMSIIRIAIPSEKEALWKMTLDASLGQRLTSINESGDLSAK